MPALKEYIVTIDREHQFTLYAKDRKDAIDFTRRNNQAKFFAGTYKKVTGAKVRREGSTSYSESNDGEIHRPEAPADVLALLPE